MEGNTHTTNENGVDSVHREALVLRRLSDPLVIVCVGSAGIGTFRTTTRQTLFRAGSDHTYCKADGSLNCGRLCGGVSVDEKISPRLRAAVVVDSEAALLNDL